MHVLDIHTHVLPGIDDGAKDLDAGIALCQREYDLGIRHIVATPHWCSPRFGEVMPPNIAAAWEALSTAVKAQIPQLDLILGAEHHLSGLQSSEDFVKTLRPLGDSKLVLIELPDDHLPKRTWQTLFDVRRKGFRPILAHPERCKGLSQTEPGLIDHVQNGGLLQITLGHLVGDQGWIMRWKSRSMVNRYQGSCIIASDSHNLGARKPLWDKLPEKWRPLVPTDLQHLQAWPDP